MGVVVGMITWNEKNEELHNIYFDFIMSNGIGYQTVSIPRAFYYTIFSEVS